MVAKAETCWRELKGGNMDRFFGLRSLSATVLGVLFVVSVFAQVPETDQDLKSLRHDAEDAARNGNCSLAAEWYKSIISTAPDAAWAYRGLADCYRRNGAWGKAAGAYELAVRYDPADSAAVSLAKLTRQAADEEQGAGVSAVTLGLVVSYPFSWAGQQEAANRNVSATGDQKFDRGLVFTTALETSEARAIPVHVAFSRNSAELNDKARARLAEAAAAMISGNQRPQRIVIEGHTCICGSVQGNIELGKKRAETVRTFLIAKGVAPATAITTISYGGSRPVESVGAPNLPASVCERDPIHSENRRVVILAYGSVNRTTAQVSPVVVSFLARPRGSTSFAPVSDGDRLHTGDEYMIRVLAKDTKAQHPIYLYVFHRQPNNKWLALAPIDATAGEMSPMPITIRPHAEVSIPAPGRGFPLDTGTGLEQTFIYARSEPDLTLDALARQVRQAQPAGGFEPLLPPDIIALPDSEKKPQRISRPTPPEPVEGVIAEGTQGSFAPKPVESAPTRSTNKSQSQGPTGSKQGQFKGLDLNVQADDGWPQLPSDPDAFVRFHHVD